MRSETTNSVLTMRAFLRNKKQYCHNYELPINYPKQKGQLLCTVLEVVDLLCLFPSMFFRKPWKASMIQNRRGADKSLARPGRKQATATKL